MHLIGWRNVFFTSNNEWKLAAFEERKHSHLSNFIEFYVSYSRCFSQGRCQSTHIVYRVGVLNVANIIIKCSFKKCLSYIYWRRIKTDCIFILKKKIFLIFHIFMLPTCKARVMVRLWYIHIVLVIFICSLKANSHV